MVWYGFESQKGTELKKKIFLTVNIEEREEISACDKNYSASKAEENRNPVFHLRAYKFTAVSNPSEK